MSGETYRIESLDDIVKLPSECIDNFCRDLRYAIEMHHFVWGEGSENVAFGPMTWTDDNNPSVTLHDKEGAELVSLKVEMKEQEVE